jgi:hypothetical protein
MKTTNLAKQGREFLEKYPSATAKDLVEKLGFKKSYATVFLHGYKRNLESKVVQEPSQGQKAVRDELVMAFKRIEYLELQCENLLYQATGYEAVISYLESKLDLED